MHVLLHHVVVGGVVVGTQHVSMRTCYASVRGAVHHTEYYTYYTVRVHATGACVADAIPDVLSGSCHHEITSSCHDTPHAQGMH